MTNSIVLAARAKGPLNFLRRAMAISRRYGATSAKMERSLAQFARVLSMFNCSATFPITGVALARNSGLVKKYQAQGVEFAIHGYRHIDHSRLAQAEQLTHLSQAKHIFDRANIQPHGFRSPYLRWNPYTLTALRQQEFAYDSSQALAWEVVDGCDTPAYRRALAFYSAQSAADYPALPRLQEGLVRIPYCLPDDEALVDRLRLANPDRMSEIWLHILHRTYELGELFTIGLHPERIALCQAPLIATLTEACSLLPKVWIARLGEIADWWQARAKASVKIADAGDNALDLSVAGPGGAAVLTRAVQTDAPAVPWINGYHMLKTTAFILYTAQRPFIGISPDASPALADFLRQQGYIVETSREAGRYSYYFDRIDFTVQEERPLLEQIEGTQRPLVRFGRWPAGAQSALCITGDIDALTIWDYVLRLLGR